MRIDQTFKLLLACHMLMSVGCSDKSTERLMERLGDSDPAVRRAAVVELGDQREATVVPALEQALGDSDTTVRLAAALEIQRIDPKNPRIRPVILESLQAGHAPMLLEVARMGHEAEWAAPTVVKLLSHPNAPVRALAAKALGKIGVADAETMAALQTRRRDSARVVRKAADTAIQALQADNGDNDRVNSAGGS